jgi:hypothetical protein
LSCASAKRLRPSPAAKLRCKRPANLRLRRARRWLVSPRKTISSPVVPEANTRVMRNAKSCHSWFQITSFVLFCSGTLRVSPGLIGGGHSPPAFLSAKSNLLPHGIATVGKRHP